MINSISGKIFKKEPTTLYIENNGIVFSISICLRDYEKLPSENENIFIYTYLNVKENLMELYGFMDLERRSLFLNLIDVSGIGLESISLPPNLEDTVISLLIDEKSFPLF